MIGMQRGAGRAEKGRVVVEGATIEERGNMPLGEQEMQVHGKKKVVTIGKEALINPANRQSNPKA